MAFVTCYQGGVAIRTAPSLDAPCAGDILQWNEASGVLPPCDSFDAWGVRLGRPAVGDFDVTFRAGLKACFCILHLLPGGARCE